MKALKTIALASLSVLTISIQAADATGKWKGKMTLNKETFKSNIYKMFGSQVKPEQKAQMNAQLDQQLNTMTSGVASLDLRKDGTFTISLPAGVAGRDPVTETGTWKQSGNTITMTTKKDPKKPNSGEPSVATLNGGKLVIDVEAQIKKKAKGPNSKIFEGTGVKMIFNR
jgi:hypothetical protein